MIVVFPEPLGPEAEDLTAFDGEVTSRTAVNCQRIVRFSAVMACSWRCPPRRGAQSEHGHAGFNSPLGSRGRMRTPKTRWAALERLNVAGDTRP
jgi:hypothetical protein